MIGISQAVEMFELNKKYELKYWLNTPKEKVQRTYPMFFDIIGRDMFNDCKVAVDIGCGAYGGVFNEITFQTMYGIDPLCDDYKQNGLVPDNDNITMLRGDSKRIISEGIRADVIFSINSLDHSGNIFQSIDDIHFSLKKGGLFAFHVHLRREEQLDAGHRMALFAKEGYLNLLYISKLKDMNNKFFNYYDRCPFGNQKSTGKKIASLIGVWEK